MRITIRILPDTLRGKGRAPIPAEGTLSLAYEVGMTLRVVLLGWTEWWYDVGVVIVFLLGISRCRVERYLYGVFALL